MPLKLDKPSILTGQSLVMAHDAHALCRHIGYEVGPNRSLHIYCNARLSRDITKCEPVWPFSTNYVRRHNNNMPPEYMTNYISCPDCQQAYQLYMRDYKQYDPDYSSNE